MLFVFKKSIEMNDEGFKQRVYKEARDTQRFVTIARGSPSPYFKDEPISPQIRSTRHGFYTIPRNNKGLIIKVEKPSDKYYVTKKD